MILKPKLEEMTPVGLAHLGHVVLISRWLQERHQLGVVVDPVLKEFESMNQLIVVLRLLLEEIKVPKQTLKEMKRDLERKLIRGRVPTLLLE